MAYRGYVERGYEPVARLFAKLIGAPDRGGGSFVVRYGDRTVVDIWGGVADPRSGRPWQRETLGLSFSTSKGVAATIVHRLADRGLLDYDEPVATYWRQFAAGGKGRITVRQLLAHQAGLDALGPVAADTRGLLDHLGAEQRLAARTPEYRPGTPAYHSITYGWLLAGLARAITGEGMETLVESEINEPLGIDGLHYGLPRSGDRGRVSACVGSLGGLVGFGRYALTWLPGPTPGRRLLHSIFVPDMAVLFSGHEPRALETVMPAANGMFTAESLATMYAALANGGVAGGRRLLSTETVRALSRVQTRARDRNLVVPMVWRLGYHQAFVPGTWLPRAFGHFGYAGSGGWCDPSTGLAVAFVSNRIFPVSSPFGDLALIKLSRASLVAARTARSSLQADRAIGWQHEHRAADAA
ncbi:MAG TPA: serine hydrolase domain-containing protein [Solirubrobacteraceae bacterium]|nr:serine hydrolase domain-containing protein [Solirubrobacteraceae bacterium]